MGAETNVPEHEVEEDHDRVMALPSYRKWLENQENWLDSWRRKMGRLADLRRARERQRHERALARIAEWEEENASRQAAHDAWRKEDEKRYWSRRKV